MGVLEEVLEGAVLDAVEEVQGEALEVVPTSGVNDRQQQEPERPCWWMWRSVLEKSGR